MLINIFVINWIHFLVGTFAIKPAATLFVKPAATSVGLLIRLIGQKTWHVIDGLSRGASIKCKKTHSVCPYSDLIFEIEIKWGRNRQAPLCYKQNQNNENDNNPERWSFCFKWKKLDGVVGMVLYFVVQNVQIGTDKV